MAEFASWVNAEEFISASICVKNMENLFPGELAGVESYLLYRPFIYYYIKQFYNKSCTWWQVHVQVPTHNNYSTTQSFKSQIY